MGKNPNCIYKFDINDYVEVRIRKDEPSSSRLWRFDGSHGSIKGFSYSGDNPPIPMYNIAFDEDSATTESLFFEDELTLVDTVDVKALLELL